MRLKIRTKLILTFLGALLIAIIVIAGAMLAILISGAGGRTNPFAVGKLANEHTALVTKAIEAGADPSAIRQAALPSQLPADLRIRVIDKEGKVWVDTEGGEGRTARGMVTMSAQIIVKGELWGFYGVSFASQYGLNINQNEESLPTRLDWMVFLGGLGLALAVNVALFWAFGWHIVKPLRRLSGVVSQIAAGDLSARAGLPERGDELGLLAQDLDLMASRLQEARDTAAAAERARRYLIAMVSHDLRTPLTALLAHAEAIRTNVSEDPQQSLAVIEKKGLMLKRLIDDLFELAALDATAERWQTVRVDLAELVRQSVVGILPKLEASGIEVEAEIPEELLFANLAPGKLERVMDNLLANALKYGASGHWLGVSVARKGERIRVEVANRGEPIPPEEAAQIFGRFYRADSARSSRVDGAGLGLTIVSEIIIRHGGEIGVDSPAFGGATFWFEVPAG